MTAPNESFETQNESFKILNVSFETLNDTFSLDKAQKIILNYSHPT